MPMTEEQIFSAISVRVGEARGKHPEFARDQYEAGEVIHDEVRELMQAIGCESRQRQIDEALDVIATCFRFIAGEHEHGSY